MPGSELKASTKMYCLGCRYWLAGLSAGKCPECGRDFDPGNPSSFSASPRRSIGYVWWLALMAAWPVLADGMVYVCFLIARLSLGRWPSRGGMDDPKTIAGLELPLALVGIMIFFSLPFVALALIFGWVLVRRHGVGIALMLSALACVSVALLFAMVHWDPGLVHMWLLD